MDWYDQKKRIRRFLRDPNGNIWSDDLLLHLYNAVQKEFQQKIGQLQDVQIIRIPSFFKKSYLYDWEWPYTNVGEGYVYQALNYYQQAEEVTCFLWEPEHIAGANSDTTDSGTYYTHPWEAFIVNTPGQIPPLWAPNKFSEVVYLAWDKKPIEPITKKRMQGDDSSWRTRSGEVQYYRRDEKLENFIRLYPIPSTIDWQDITPSDSEDQEYVQNGYGMALYSSEDTDSSDYGVIVSGTGNVLNQDEGVPDAVYTADDNLLMVFSKTPKDLDGDEDESDLPVYLRKYVEYGVLERAYSANTDGKIESLKNYWGYRKELAFNVIKIFNGKKRVDRDYRLATKDVPARAVRRTPRLPDAYPAMW